MSKDVCIEYSTVVSCPNDIIDGIKGVTLTGERKEFFKEVLKRENGYFKKIKLTKTIDTLKSLCPFLINSSLTINNIISDKPVFFIDTADETYNLTIFQVLLDAEISGIIDRFSSTEGIKNVWLKKMKAAMKENLTVECIEVNSKSKEYAISSYIAKAIASNVYPVSPEKIFNSKPNCGTPKFIEEKIAKWKADNFDNTVEDIKFKYCGNSSSTECISNILSYPRKKGESYGFYSIVINIRTESIEDMVTNNFKVNFTFIERRWISEKKPFKLDQKEGNSIYLFPKDSENKNAFKLQYNNVHGERWFPKMHEEVLFKYAKISVNELLDNTAKYLKTEVVVAIPINAMIIGGLTSKDIVDNPGLAPLDKYFWFKSIIDVLQKNLKDDVIQLAPMGKVGSLSEDHKLLSKSQQKEEVRRKKELSFLDISGNSSVELNFRKMLYTAPSDVMNIVYVHEKKHHKDILALGCKQIKFEQSIELLKSDTRSSVYKAHFANKDVTVNFHNILSSELITKLTKENTEAFKDILFNVFEDITNGVGKEVSLILDMHDFRGEKGDPYALIKREAIGRGIPTQMYCGLVDYNGEEEISKVISSDLPEEEKFAILKNSNAIGGGIVGIIRNIIADILSKNGVIKEFKNLL